MANLGNNELVGNVLVKSPSDTTIYAPALKYQRFGHNLSPGLEKDDKGGGGISQKNVEDALKQLRVNDFPGDRTGDQWDPTIQ